MADVPVEHPQARPSRYPSPRARYHGSARGVRSRGRGSSREGKRVCAKGRTLASRFYVAGEKVFCSGLRANNRMCRPAEGVVMKREDVERKYAAADRTLVK